ncbi:MAG: hypothetical protein ACRENE_19840 [Polyangiaceae bacterium]
MTATIQASTGNYVLATWQDLVLAVWCGDTTMAGVRDGQRIFDEHAARSPSGVLLLTVVEEQAPMPDSEARAGLGRLLKNGAGRTRRSAVVYEGAGFRAATVRSVVTGITALSKPPFPHKIFATVEQAAGFLVEGELTTTRSQITTVVTDVRDRHRAALKLRA